MNLKFVYSTIQKEILFTVVSRYLHRGVKKLCLILKPTKTVKV
jgi:hypothetical protein